MKSSNKFITALLTVVLGVLFIALKAEVISIAMTIFGVALIVLAVLDLIDKQIPYAIVKGVLGVVVLVLGWVFVSAALYIMAALLLVYGLLYVYQLFKVKTKQILAYVSPAIMVVAAICLLFAQGQAISAMFVISGVFLIVEGVLMMVDVLKK